VVPVLLPQERVLLPQERVLLSQERVVLAPLLVRVPGGRAGLLAVVSVQRLPRRASFSAARAGTTRSSSEARTYGLVPRSR